LAVAAIAVLALTALVFLLVDHAPAVPATASPSDRIVITPAAERSSPVAPTTPIAGDEVDACGNGRPKREASDGVLSEAGTDADKTLGRLAAKLAASPNERDSALGLFLRRSMVYWEEHRDPRDQVHTVCDDDQSCRQYTPELGARQSVAIRDTLVRMATASRDPQVYALAFHSCGDGYGTGAESACTLLSAARWAELEPDNGVPWLFLAGAAQAGNNGAARDQAVYRASTARRFDARFPNFVGLLQSPGAQAEAPENRSALASDLVGMEVTRPSLSYKPFLQYCNYPSEADATRISVCSDLANLLIKHDGTLLGLAMGVRLAQSAGWPPEVVNALREEKKALFVAARYPIGERRTERLDADCEELVRFEQWVADYARLGELGVARKFLEKSGSAPTQFVPPK
jgi:hypothetical protein